MSRPSESRRDILNTDCLIDLAWRPPAGQRPLPAPSTAIDPDHSPTGDPGALARIHRGHHRLIASAQISVYPLRQDRLGPAVETARAALAAYGLSPQIGPMSTIVVGEDTAIFAALSEAFAKAAELGEVMMTITVSNACLVAR